MARGSSGGGSGGSGSVAVGMLGDQGSIQNTGKYVIRKKFFTSNQSELTQVPTPPPGFRATAVNWQAIGGGAFEQTIDYESHLGASQAGDVVETISGIEGRFELDVQDELVDIGMHPNIRDLIRKYSGVIDPGSGKVTFPPTYTPTAEGGLSGGTRDGVQTNPMAGKRYFSKMAATFRHTQQTDTIPADIWLNCGKMVAKLPANFPNPPDFINKDGETMKYHWIVLSPQIYRRGNAYEIVRSYKLSEPNVPAELYEITTVDTNKK